MGISMGFLWDIYMGYMGWYFIGYIHGIYNYPNSWDDDPIWRTHIFQRGRLNHQLTWYNFTKPMHHHWMVPPYVPFQCLPFINWLIYIKELYFIEWFPIHTLETDVFWNKKNSSRGKQYYTYSYVVSHKQKEQGFIFRDLILFSYLIFAGAMSNPPM